MKKLMVIVLTAMLVFAATSAFAADELLNAKAGFGGLTLGGVFKAGFNYYIGDETLGANADGAAQAMDNGKDMEFLVNYWQLSAAGWVINEHITYLTSFNADASTGALNVLDMVLGFNYIPYTGIYVGKMLPAMTYWNQVGTAKFQTIDQPLMNRVLFTRARQLGLNFGMVTPYLNANLGVYNGRTFNVAFLPLNADPVVGDDFWNGDENTGKDIHFGLVGKPPVDGLNIRANLWYATPLDGYENDQGDLIEHNATVMAINAGVDYLAPYGLTLVGDFLYMSYAWDSADPATNFEDDRVGGDGEANAEDYQLTAMAYYLMAGYNFGPVFEVPIELIARYDYVDPDTLNDEKKDGHAASEQDALTDITAGVNYYIKGNNAKLSMFYTYHGEAWEDVLNKAGDDTQTGINNDDLKLQVQVAF